MIIYEGPSLLDGKPIVAIAIASENNSKTGVAIQTYILCATIDPRDASKNGADYSICGNCPMRGEVTTDPKRKIAKGRKCYVILGQGVLIVYNHYKKGGYPIGNRADIIAMGAGNFVRIGTYGDPAAVPIEVWQSLISEAKNVTAYSHQSGWHPELAMQSANSLEEARYHWERGNRTFRVIADLGEVIKEQETICPASHEGGRRVQCVNCRLCFGNKPGRSIVIVDHGPTAKKKVTA